MTTISLFRTACRRLYRSCHRWTLQTIHQWHKNSYNPNKYFFSRRMRQCWFSWTSLSHLVNSFQHENNFNVMTVQLCLFWTIGRECAWILGKGTPPWEQGTRPPRKGWRAAVGSGQWRRRDIAAWPETRETVPPRLQEAVMHRVSAVVHCTNK